MRAIRGCLLFCLLIEQRNSSSLPLPPIKHCRFKREIELSTPTSDLYRITDKALRADRHQRSEPARPSPARCAVPGAEHHHQPAQPAGGQ